MDQKSWNALIASLHEPQLLQTWQWSRVKACFDWQSIPTVWRDQHGEIQAAAMLLSRELPIQGISQPYRVMYVPKGPLLRDWSNAEIRHQVFRDLRFQAESNNAIFIKIDPEIRLGVGVPGQSEAQEDPMGYKLVNELKELGWRFSGEQVQFRNTVLVDLSSSEDELLGFMKQKTRYNIRLSRRKGVTVRVGDLSDIDMLYAMYAETSVRDGFVIRDKNYYQAVWETFIKSDMAVPLIAELEGEPVAALIFFYFESRAWYMYGMSRSIHREKMATYQLQWEAMKRAKAVGCKVYDLWGAPDRFVDDDPLWGVYRFKEGMGGIVVRHIGAWDLPIRPFYYQVYTQVLPRLLSLMRNRGKARIKGEVLKG
jgi:peptidoglycan pentaglycine glycine transferase (the first glycine)